jgi:predicted RNA methylase
MEDLSTSILKVLGEASSIGATAKQVALRTGYDIQIISKYLEELHQEGKIEKIGRKLWLLDRFKDINYDPQFRGPEWYTKLFKDEEGVVLEKYPGKITFSDNGNRFIHRWSPYVQGFSASFVETILNRYQIGKQDCVLDPFVGCGTVLVCARLRGAKSIGVDLMPLMAFASKVKTRWNLDVKEIEANLKKIRELLKEELHITPPFLRETYRQFDEKVLTNLLKLKQSIWSIENQHVRELFQLAFASSLIDCSRLKRSPCLSYVKEKMVAPDAPFITFEKKVKQMISDLSQVQRRQHEWGPEPQVISLDAKEVKYEPESVDITITSPPYVNGMDYVINYKIEMAWLDMVKSYAELKMLKNKMVACDNLCKKVVQEFSKRNLKLCDEWLDNIIERINNKISEKGNYRRNDMHLIVQKYFDDIYPVFKNVYEGLKPNGRFIIVIGDSLIAGTYIPTDLILARIGKKIGFKIESIEVARTRRSGQRRNFILRESVLTLVKGQKRQPKILESFFN